MEILSVAQSLTHRKVEIDENPISLWKLKLTDGEDIFGKNTNFELN